MKLHPDWLSWPETKTLIAAFAEYPGSLRFVGGAVRDSLLGRDVLEVDGATTRYPGEVMSLAIRNGLRAIPTGLEHGTVTVVVEKRSFEITTLRKDIKTDGRHAEVTFTDSWQEDAQRRDFTMNALYLSPEGELFDYFGGETDARAGVVRFIGEPEARIREDYLRILRLFRFYAHYGKEPLDAGALAACKQLASQLKNLPAERIWQELSKLLAASSSAPSLAAMYASGVLPYVLGFEVTGTEALARLEALGAKMGIAIMADTKLAALLACAPTEASASALADRLKCPNSTRKNMQQLQALQAVITPDMTQAAQKKLIRSYGSELAAQAIALVWARSEEDYAAMLSFARSWQVPEFPVTGSDLLACGMPPGKAVGETLARLEALWEESGYRWGRGELLARRL
jgi:poly(A) polymerase